MKAKRILIVISFSIFLISGITGQAQSPARLVEMGQVKRAKQIYLKMYRAGQTNETDFYYNLGKLYLNNNQPDSASFFFTKGTEIDQKNPMNWVGLARYFYQVGDSVQAKAKLKNAAQFARNSQNYYLGIAEMYMQPKPGRPDLAVQFIDKALSQKGNNPNAHILKGDHYLTYGSAGDAANEYKQAMFYDKKNPVTYYKAGMVYAKGRIYQEAINSMQKAIACDSGFIPAYRELGEIYLLFDKYRLAHEAYDKYISLIEPDTRDLIRYGSILVLDKDFESALKIINKLKENNVQDPKVLRIQAYTDFETGHYDTGLAEIRAFFEKADPEEPLATDYEYYAQLLKKNNLDSLAIPQYLKAIEIDSTRKVLYEQVAKTCEKVKNYPAAAHYYELNLANKEPTQVDYFKIGWLYYLTSSNKIVTDSILRSSYIDHASRNFLKVCELSPANHLGWFWEARTQALKDPESEAGLAKPYYEKALTLMEPSPEKFKKEITEALKYLGYYHYLRFEQSSLQAKKEEIPVFRDSSSLYWKRIIAIDPADKQANDALTALKKK